MPRKISYRMSKLSTFFAKARKKTAERARKSAKKWILNMQKRLLIVIQLKLGFFKEMDQWIEKHGKKASEMDVDEMRKMQMVYMQQLHHWSQQQQKVGPRSSAIHPEACKKSVEILAIFLYS